MYIYIHTHTYTHIHLSPDWCGSAGWLASCKPKGHQFDFCSGHMAGLQLKSPVGAVQ